MIRFIEYDEGGEIFHVAEIHTTEGHLPRPPHDAPTRVRTAHAKKVANAIVEREAATLSELHAHIKAGKRLIVLADGETAHPGTHRVHAGRVVRK